MEFNCWKAEPCACNSIGLELSRYCSASFHGVILRLSLWWWVIELDNTKIGKDGE